MHNFPFNHKILGLPHFTLVRQPLPNRYLFRFAMLVAGTGLEPVIAQRLCLCLHSCGARHCARLERGALVDRGASFCSLLRPPGALATSLRKPFGRRFITLSMTKKSQTPYGYLRFLVRVAIQDFSKKCSKLKGLAQSANSTISCFIIS